MEPKIRLLTSAATQWDGRKPRGLLFVNGEEEFHALWLARSRIFRTEVLHLDPIGVGCFYIAGGKAGTPQPSLQFAEGSAVRRCSHVARGLPLSQRRG